MSRPLSQPSLPLLGAACLLLLAGLGASGAAAVAAESPSTTGAGSAPSAVGSGPTAAAGNGPTAVASSPSAIGASSPQVVGAEGPSTVAASGPRAVRGVGVADSCRYDNDPDLPGEGAWIETFADPLANDSLADWAGGRTVPVGARGDCSLLVADGDTATLTAATVNGTDGVVAGTLDLGANGSLRLVGADGESALIVANDGPDYAAAAVARAGDRSANLSLPSGRFFAFAVALDANGTARVAVWEPDGRWDGTWDARFETAATADSLRVRLRGRAFLDGVAIGVADAAAERSAGDPGPDGAAADDSDDWPGPGTRPGGVDAPGDPRTPAGDDDSDAGTAVVGVFLTGVGAIGVRYAYGLTRFNEQLDAIGSTTSASAVEPADWNVALTRIVSGLLAVAGLFMLALAIL